MKLYLCFVLLWFSNVTEGLSPEEEITQESCCNYGEDSALPLPDKKACKTLKLPDYVMEGEENLCQSALISCCEKHMKQKEECSAGMKLASNKRCSVAKSEIAKTCCEECSFGILEGESRGLAACSAPSNIDISPSLFLRINANYHCCVDAANNPEPVTEKEIETTTRKKRVKQTCKEDSCEHVCNDSDGNITCQCRFGYRLHTDKKSCKDINECAEAEDDLCTEEGTVCHNIQGSFKCVPVRKRDVGISCPPGFKRNVVNQVCDDINECQLLRPPCPKYLCENTIGGYKCGGKPGKPFSETVPGAPTEGPTQKNDICPQGFRAGPDDECEDIDECAESLDDCQHLSQHCINTHGNFFCQDHVSKRCAPGFKVNTATGICEDIDECEESLEVCKRNEICVNLPGAYNCKSKISTLPKLATKVCQEGTRLRVGGSTCEDIDECREGTHLCDQFQNCINTFGGHECRCKNGFELDSASGSCADVDECALKLDNCSPGTYCVNVLGSFTCSRRRPSTTPPVVTTSTTASPIYDYEYYDSDEDNSTTSEMPPTTTSTPRPTTRTPPRRMYRPTIAPTTSPRPTPPPTTTPQPTTTPKPTLPPPTTPPPTSPPPTTSMPPPPPLPPKPDDIPPTAVLPPKPEDNPSRRPENYPRTTRRPPYTRFETPRTFRTSTRKPEVTTTEIDNNVDEKPSSFNPNDLHCLFGFQRNSNGECVDIDECATNRHLCTNLEVCINSQGRYSCECIAGFKRNDDGWCVAARTTTSSTTTSMTPAPTPVAITPNSPPWRYSPSIPRENTEPGYTNKFCELGYTYDRNYERCVDVDECATNKADCGPKEDCVNIDGGYKCVCGRNCRADLGPVPGVPTGPTYDTNIITVGAQYGQRGARYSRPSMARLPETGAIVRSCPWGYKLTQERRCSDIDECALNKTNCKPGQRCENFYGGYSCQCPDGHRLAGDACEDVDECSFSSPCPYNAKCMNTVGSFRCICGEGFRNAPTNDKICVDVDECSEVPDVCGQQCINTWGGYRCYCQQGYRVGSDNRTCEDIDECSEWSSVRLRGRLCGGQCVNEPGSYRCSCPTGYRLADDLRSCIDIDECETGEASCARNPDPGEVCQNTRGSYHCHKIDCPSGYRLEAKHRCARVQRMCQLSDWRCLQQPSSYSYNFITFVANIYLPAGSVDLFTMHGPSWKDSVVNFEMRMLGVQASPGVKPADLRCFDMRPSGNVCVVSLLCSLEGPQVAELELTMTLYQRGQFAGSAVARLVVIVSAYEF